MSRRDRPTLGTVLAASALLSAGAVLVAPRPAALLGGLALALVLPGAALARLLFPGRALAVPEWVVVAPALSLATLALGGLGLYAAGVGLDRSAWLALTAGVAVTAAVAGQVRAWFSLRWVFRRAGSGSVGGDGTGSVGGDGAGSVGGDGAASVGRGGRLGRRTPLWAVRLDPVVGHAAPTAAGTPARSDVEVPATSDAEVPARSDVEVPLPVVGRVTFRRAVLRLLPLAVAAMMMGGALWYSVQGAEQTRAVPFTALELVPAYASEAPGRTRTVSVGLHCEEHEVTGYRLRIRGASRFEMTLRARLRPGESWARQVRVPATGRVTVDLFRDGDDSAYRTVFLESTR